MLLEVNVPIFFKKRALTLCEIDSVQGRTRHLFLVTTWISLTALPAGEPLEQIWGKPSHGSLLGRFWDPHLWNSAPASSCPRPSTEYYTSDILYWIRTATAQCSRPLSKIWCNAGGVYVYLEWTPWYFIQKFRFGVGIPPHSRLSIVQRSGLPLWTGSLQIFHFPTYRPRPWTDLFCKIV